MIELIQKRLPSLLLNKFLELKVVKKDEEIYFMY